MDKSFDEFVEQLDMPYKALAYMLLSAFKHPDAVYIKDMRTIEYGSRAAIFLLVHNASEYDYEEGRLETYFFSYSPDDLYRYLRDVLGSKWDEQDKEYLELVIEDSVLLKDYQKSFVNSRVTVERT